MTDRKPPARPEPGPVPLLVAILDGIPALPDAACRGHERLFDPPTGHERPEDTAQRHHAAAKLCAQCPALEPCRQWAQTQRPYSGVVGGRVPTPPGRPAAELRGAVR